MGPGSESDLKAALYGFEAGSRSDSDIVSPSWDRLIGGPSEARRV